MKTGSDYILINHIDYLKEDYSDELYKYLRERMCDKLSEGKRREVYREAATYVVGIGKLKDGWRKVEEILSSLRVSDFSEARLDADDPNPPILMIFGKKINNREIYIKIKNRESEDLHQVICVSFHYSQWEMMYPYKN